MQEFEIIFPSMATRATEHIFLFNQYLSFDLGRSRAEDVEAAVCETFFHPLLNLHYLENSPSVEQVVICNIWSAQVLWQEESWGEGGAIYVAATTNGSWSVQIVYLSFSQKAARLLQWL